jgi:prophage DNA circulation protein
MSDPRFDISLPGLYKDKWREAYRADKDDGPRLSSYQSPDGDPIPFIYENLDFSGGQAIDTAEYPFFGLWSNEPLNQKPQTITVHGFLRGEYYLQQRAAFLDALMVPSSDDAPGFFDHPLWGRFKVIVDAYTISESADANGQCKISLTLKRAGVSLETRATVLKPIDFTGPEAAALAAIKKFSELEADIQALLQAFGFIKTQLLNITGRIQAAQTVLNTLTNEITGISNLIAQGIQTPKLLAEAAVNAVFSIAASLVSIGESVQAVSKYFSGQNNKKNMTVYFLSAASFSLPITTATVRQAETKRAAENFYRTISLCAAAKIMAQMDDVTYQKMAGYWTLYKKLEDSINLENTDIYIKITEMRSALSEALRNTAMSNELKKNIEKPSPLLYIAHHLGCDDEKLRQMNVIEDSLLVSGEVVYV